MTTPAGRASTGGRIDLGIESAAESEPSLSLLALFGVYLLLRWVDRAAPPTFDNYGGPNSRFPA
jgi:hypothetical protein